MARELRWWLAATLVACGLIALGYIPPRGAVPESKSRDLRPQLSGARKRAQTIANQWRAANLALRLAEYRRRLEPELARRRTTDQPGPALLVDGPDTIPVYTRELLRSSLDTVWSQLGLGVTKVAVGVVVDFWSWQRAASPQGTPKETHEASGYLFPDSTDRSTCVALIPAWYRFRTLLTAARSPRSPQVEDWLRNGLGPCAFVAAYGAPGRTVRRWLARRYYDLALVARWDRERSEQPEESWVMNPNASWFWDVVYGHPIDAIGCLSGRTASCRAAVLAGAGDAFDDSLPRLLSTDVWWWRGQRLVYGEGYLSDVARQVGRDRFLRFWNSTEPVDTALAAVLTMPVGKWTERWQRRLVPRLPLGAAVPFSAAALGILLGAAAVIGVALNAGRREVG